MKQMNFSFVKQYKKEFGGSLLVSKRKAKRPLATNQPLHYILRANTSLFFKPGDRKIEQIFAALTEKYKIKVFQKSVNWNHFHAILQIPSRESYVSFARQFSSELVKLLRSRKMEDAVIATQAASHDKHKIEKIFNLRPYTRVASWGRDLQNLQKYHDKNNRQAWNLSQGEFDFIDKMIDEREHNRLPDK